jgi:hypothetical protein
MTKIKSYESWNEEEDQERFQSHRKAANVNQGHPKREHFQNIAPIPFPSL